MECTAFDDNCVQIRFTNFIASIRHFFTLYLPLPTGTHVGHDRRPRVLGKDLRTFRRIDKNGTIASVRRSWYLTYTTRTRNFRLHEIHPACVLCAWRRRSPAEKMSTGIPSKHYKYAVIPSDWIDRHSKATPRFPLAFDRWPLHDTRGRYIHVHRVTMHLHSYG